MKLKKRQVNTLTQAAKKKQQKEVMVLDYAKKRGANKKRKPEDEKEEVEMSTEVPKVRILRTICLRIYLLFSNFCRLFLFLWIAFTHV